MAYTARLTKQQLRQRRDATRDRSLDNTKGTVQYLVTYAYTNNICLLCASNIIVSVAIPTKCTPFWLEMFKITSASGAPPKTPLGSLPRSPKPPGRKGILAFGNSSFEPSALNPS